MSEQYLLSVQDLPTSFRTDSGEVQAVNGVSFNLNPGEILGIVGESGSGKSVTAYSIMQILADNGSIKSGHILYKGEDLTTWSEKQMSHFRGKCCSIVFQDPMTSLNPVFTIGNEAIRLHTNRKGKEVRDRAIEMLELVGINEPEKRIKQYPFELSGGMRQRVMIAMALACEPDILIADEPTTALDVTIQAQILELMQDLQKKLGMAVILVTHDLGVIADMCDNIIVMYGGRISLMVGFVVVFLEILLGIIMGGLAGYYGGWVDNLIMRLVDIFYCLPSMPIMIILGAMMDALRMNTYVRLMIMMAALGIMGWAGVARMVRGQILSLREQEFMVATEATGIRVKDRIFRHLVPNVMPQLIVIASLGIGGTIITESTLSFLGLGVKHPLATWGTIINSVSSASAMAHYPFIWIPVGLLICMTVIAFNFVGDGLRDAYDPKAKR